MRTLPAHRARSSARTISVRDWFHYKIRAIEYLYGFTMYVVGGRRANHLMVSEFRCPQTTATPAVSQVRCQTFNPHFNPIEPPEPSLDKTSTSVVSRPSSLGPWSHSGQAGTFIQKRGSTTVVSCLPIMSNCRVFYPGRRLRFSTIIPLHSIR